MATHSRLRIPTFMIVAGRLSECVRHAFSPDKPQPVGVVSPEDMTTEQLRRELIRVHVRYQLVQGTVKRLENRVEDQSGMIRELLRVLGEVAATKLT